LQELRRNPSLFGPLAIAGILVQPHADVVQTIRQSSTNRDAVKEQLRRVSAHNQKLGFNWYAVPGKRGFYDISTKALKNLLKDSTYKTFVVDLAKLTDIP